MRDAVRSLQDPVHLGLAGRGAARTAGTVAFDARNADQGLSEIARKLQFAEGVVPARWRLPLRYGIQRVTGGLEPEMAVLDQLLVAGGVATSAPTTASTRTRWRASPPRCIASSRYPRAAHTSRPQRSKRCRSTTAPCPTARAVCACTSAGRSARGAHPRFAGKTSGCCEILDVDVRTVDSFAMPRVDFIKIGRGRCGSRHLRGAVDTLERHRPALLVEIDRARHSRDSFDALLGWLAARGYAPHVLASGDIRRSENPWADAAEHMNFLFPVPQR